MLDINWGTLLLQIANFLVMVFILWRFLFKPVVKILDERSKKVTSALEEAERKEREANEMRTEYEEKLAETQDQMITMQQTAQEELARAKSKLLDEARQEIQTMREKAQAETQEARQQAVYQHRRELGQLVTTLSARMMRESAGDAFQRASVEGFIERLDALPADEYRQTLDATKTEMVYVQLVSAQELDTDSLAHIEKQVRAMVGQPVEVQLKIDPSLVAGATVRFGDVVIDGSLAGQLQHLKEQYMVELEQSKI